MDILKRYNKNRKKHLLKEVTAGAGAVGAEHQGRGGSEGMRVDDIFAGGYVANDNVKGDLTRQLKDRIDKRKYMVDVQGEENIGVEHPLGGYHDIESEELFQTYDYLQALVDKHIKYNEENTPISDPNWYIMDDDSWKKLVDKRKLEIEKQKEIMKKYVNDTDHYELIDDIEEKEFKRDKKINKNYINDSETNWKIIYESKKVRR